MIEGFSQQSEQFDAVQTRIKNALAKNYYEFKSHLSEADKKGNAPHTATVPSCDLWYWKTNTGISGSQFACKYRVVKNYSGFLGYDEDDILHAYPAPVLTSELAMFTVFLDEQKLMLRQQPGRYLRIANSIFAQAFRNAAHIREIVATTSQLQILESPGFASLNNLGSLTQAEEVYEALLVSDSHLAPGVLSASLNAYRDYCSREEWAYAIERPFPAYTAIYDLAKDIQIDQWTSHVVEEKTCN